MRSTVGIGAATPNEHCLHDPQRVTPLGRAAKGIRAHTFARAWALFVWGCPALEGGVLKWVAVCDGMGAPPGAYVH